MGKPVFTIISQSNCPWCFRAKQELAKRDYDYKVQQIGKDLTAQEFRAVYPNHKTVPLVLIQEKHDGPRRVLGSYNELMEFLENGNSAVTATSEDTDGNQQEDHVAQH